MSAVKTYQLQRQITVEGQKHIIFVYGEMKREKHVNAFKVEQIEASPKGLSTRNVVKTQVFTDNKKQLPYKTFDMGWAICCEEDNFDMLVGIKMAKKRFSGKPLKTQNGCFLTDDMIYAILTNELNFIEKNIEKYLPNRTTDKIYEITIDDDFNENHTVIKEEPTKSECDDVKQYITVDDMKPGELYCFESGVQTLAGIFKYKDDKQVVFHWVLIDDKPSDTLLYNLKLNIDALFNIEEEKNHDLLQEYLRKEFNREWDFMTNNFRYLL